MEKNHPDMGDIVIYTIDHGRMVPVAVFSDRVAVEKSETQAPVELEPPNKPLEKEG